MGRKKQNSNIPTYDECIKPTVEALIALGGSGSVEEINDKVAEILKISDEVLDIPHGNDTRSEVEYRLAWTKYYLKRAGIIDNSTRGVWSLSVPLTDAKSIDPDEIVRKVKEGLGKSTTTKKENKKTEPTTESQLELEIEEGIKLSDWKEKLLNKLKSLSPFGFERICQRLLREAGFQQVTVTQKTRDGGFDGDGILQINPLVSMKVLFQCKRYLDNTAVTAPDVSKFRGTLSGRADKGIILTTGRFTEDAKKEAIRAGAIQIEIVNGEKLVEMFEMLTLGLKPKTVYEIDDKFFEEYL